jgi:hypothetical protein
MSLPRLYTRVTRLEDDARRVVWVADVRGSLVRLMAEAGAEVELPPAVVHDLCTAFDQALQVLSQSVPACLTDLQAVDAFASNMVKSVLTILDTQITDPRTRDRLRKALAQACRREARHIA